MEYIDQVIMHCKIAKKTKPINKFILKDMSELNDIAKAIYVIEQIGGDIKKTFSDFSKYKMKKERACAKLNEPSKTMYVGSSTTGIRNRIKQHKEFGPIKTYALHLKRWFRGKYKITVYVYDEKIERAVLQIIEDNLSHKLKPAFGKRGGNNK